MRRLLWEASFRRAFKRVTRRSPLLQDKVFQVLLCLVENPSDPVLKTHKLSGRLSGLWACWVEYDCRIIFAFKPDPDGEMLRCGPGVFHAAAGLRLPTG